MPLSSAPGWGSESPDPGDAHPSIAITVQGYLTLRESLGRRRLSLPAESSLHGLLAILWEDLGGDLRGVAFDDAGALREHLVILLNGVHCRHLPDGVSTALKDGDRVDIFPPIAGG